MQLSRERELSDLEQQGLIQAFEFTFELGWKTLKDLIMETMDFEKSPGPNTIISVAAEKGFVDKDDWDEMHEARKWTVHAYDDETAAEIAKVIVGKFHGMFIRLETKLQVEKLNREKEE